ncbi:Copine-5 [Orchesella cincta]|uniref:Copine-5 n=1 Tax=Orchesella cincta TaxID=48709 RepID=A0A1D2NI65_ORCCI|nr:Copine-5 [Orchesella cincta]
MIRTLCVAALVAATVQAAPIDTIKLRFKISARDLPDKDTLGTIDPYVQIFYNEDGNKEETELGRTGTVTDNENPDFGDEFEFEFVRAKRQRWHFKVYDHDNAREDDKAGEAYIDVADYVDKNQHLNVNLNKKGYLILSTLDQLPPVAPPAPVVQTVPVISPVPTHVQQIHTVPIVQPGVAVLPSTGGVLLVPQPHTITVPEKAKLRFKVSAKDLPEKDKLGSIDPYVELYYTEGASTKESRFGKSSTIDNNKNPQWGEVFEFDYDRSKQQKWHFKIYDYDQGKEDDSGGKVWIDVNDFVQKGQTITVNLSKKGTLTVTNVNPQTTPTQQTLHHVAPVAPVSPVAPVAPQAPVIQVSNPLTRIKFRLSASGLEDKDILGTSDPHVKVFSKIGSQPEQLVGRTAKLDDTENPVWPDTIDFEYEPSQQPKLHFLVLDDDDGRRDDELGDAWLDVNEYVKKNQDESVSLKKGILNIQKA